MKNFKFVGIKNLFTVNRLLILLISIILLYWGIFSNLVFPIIKIINDPSVGNVLISVIRIFLLSGLLTGLGLSFMLITLSANKLK
jgi:hypothetical protein